MVDTFIDPVTTVLDRSCLTEEDVYAWLSEMRDLVDHCGC